MLENNSCIHNYRLLKVYNYGLSKCNVNEYNVFANVQQTVRIQYFLDDVVNSILYTIKL